MILTAELKSSIIKAFPRIRGGDPARALDGGVLDKLFPAYAGVIPATLPFPLRQAPFPRIRGGDPNSM